MNVDERNQNLQINFIFFNICAFKFSGNLFSPQMYMTPSLQIHIIFCFPAEAV